MCSNISRSAVSHNTMLLSLNMLCLWTIIKQLQLLSPSVPIVSDYPRKNDFYHNFSLFGLFLMVVNMWYLIKCNFIFVTANNMYFFLERTSPHEYFIDVCVCSLWVQQLQEFYDYTFSVSNSKVFHVDTQKT